MSGKFVVTLDHDTVYSALLNEKDQLIELHPEKTDTHSLVGNIYIGKVSNIVKGIRATFVDIGLEKDVFLQMEEGQHFIYTNNTPSHTYPKVGDELLVQITKDEHKAKSATATSLISLTGRYCVLTYHKSFVGLSSKIKHFHERSRLKDVFSPFITEDYGFIIRTNAEGVSEEDLTRESELLISTFNHLKQISPFRNCFQCIYKEPANYLRLIRDLYQNDISTYLFDDEGLYQQALDYFNEDYYDQLSTHFELRLLKDYTHYQAFGFKAKIDKALNEKVWLDSGANLFIQSTEALMVIDVNSSKSSSKKNFDETVFNINLEAAHEIARQIRLRNLSGIIIIDFIDMQVSEHKQILLDTLATLFLQDRIKTTVIDMTPLGLVEITRKKSDKNLYEKFKNLEVKINEQD